jgi:hypothetical protein
MRIIRFPEMFRISQASKAESVKDIGDQVHQELQKLNLNDTIKSGDSVSIAVGSRGIAGMAEVLAALVGELKKLKAKPFLFPAMGSHGGATAKGQKQVLQHLGITAKQIGAPIKSSMDVISIGTTAEKFPLFLDKHAYQSNHIVIVNRIKPHTDFIAKIESGLMKMMAVGIGKKMAAAHAHTQFMQHGHYKLIRSVARELIRKCPIRFGLGIVENQKDQVALIRAIPAGEIEVEEAKLLRKAKARLAKIPFAEVDLLIVDQMGKDISGTGMDQNVIGRSVIPYARVPSKAKMKRIVVLDLTEATNGSAVGIGNADFTTRRLVDKIDRQVTYTNCITACAPEMARVPPYFENDYSAIKAAIQSLGVHEVEGLKIVHIKNTLLLSEMEVSDALLGEARACKKLKVNSSGAKLQFDGHGNMKSCFADGSKSKTQTAVMEKNKNADRFVW